MSGRVYDTYLAVQVFLAEVFFSLLMALLRGGLFATISRVGSLVDGTILSDSNLQGEPRSLKEVELRPGWFLYRCESCGFEHPQMAVKKQYLVAPPAHACPKSYQLNFADILKSE